MSHSFLHLDTYLPSAWHRARCYRSVLTEPCRTPKKCPKRKLKIPMELQDWCFSNSIVCEMSQVKLKHIKILWEHRTSLRGRSQGHQNSGLPRQTPSSLLNTVDIELQQCNEQCSLNHNSSHPVHLQIKNKQTMKLMPRCGDEPNKTFHGTVRAVLWLPLLLGGTNATK